ncbi:hypothetical protein [uncultured Cocleimonas sp.]|uniref:hypothetical protein n=1 Tax=uncultured Cocleimonas sp. TaxID=1051587 RepID=UPI00261B6812|nr:hypothetical protein [uncultured Cocleimonas sp.]
MGNSIGLSVGRACTNAGSILTNPSGIIPNPDFTSPQKSFLVLGEPIKAPPHTLTGIFSSNKNKSRKPPNLA